jgi:hypothetical protein
LIDNMGRFVAASSKLSLRLERLIFPHSQIV